MRIDKPINSKTLRGQYHGQALPIEAPPPAHSLMGLALPSGVYTPQGLG